MIGRTLAHYRITAAIGKGGMGEVYRATDTRLGREVAVKLLPPDVAGSRERLERFRREAKALAALDHGHRDRLLCGGVARSWLTARSSMNTDSSGYRRVTSSASR